MALVLIMTSLLASPSSSKSAVRIPINPFEIVHRASPQRLYTFKSKFFDFQNVKVTPEPIQKPHPPIWLGGFTPAALRRAVRFGDGFTVPGANRDVYDRYVSELKKENRADNIRFASGFWCLIVSDDPEKTFAEASDHIIYQVNNYSEWLAAAGLQPLAPHLSDREELRQSGLAPGRRPRRRDKHDPELHQTSVPITHFYSWTLPPGLPPRWAQTHLELFASKVIPAFR